MRTSCRRCGVAHGAAKFNTHPTNASGLGTYCSPCNTIIVRERRALDPERSRLQGRKAHLKLKYGMTPEQWQAMFVSQGNKCAICGCGETSVWHTDHDHVTNCVRAILCRECNLVYTTHLEANFERFVEYHNGLRSVDVGSVRGET